MNTNNSSYNDRQGQSREIDQVVQVYITELPYI
jgi:hypothetical protein